MEEPPQPPDTVQLNSNDLLSKWGFFDGGQLNWLYEFGDLEPRATLVELVRRKLLPALEQKVEIEVIETCHNPVRAKSVDGQDVTRWHYEIENPIEMTPRWVIVPGAEVLEIAQNLLARREACRR